MEHIVAESSALVLDYSTSIGKIFIASQCRCAVSRKVVVGLEIIASIATHKLILLQLIRTLMSKSLIIIAFMLTPSSIPTAFAEWLLLT